MRLQDLSAFLLCARLSNLHRAAEQLDTTQSALSKVLARLESEVGLPLFQRTSRGIVLTESGITLQRYAEKIVLALGDLNNELGEQKAARSGVVRIGSIPYLLSNLISPILADFIAYRPLARFSVETQLSSNLVAMLENGELDLIVAALPTPGPAKIETSALGTIRLETVARNAHPRRHDLNNLEGLSRERWVLPAKPLYLRKSVEERFFMHQLPAPAIAVESSASPVIFANLLRVSDLVGLMPSYMLKTEAGYGLSPVGSHCAVWEHEIAIGWRRDGYLSPLNRDIRDVIIEKYGQQTQELFKETLS